MNKADKINIQIEKAIDRDMVEVLYDFPLIGNPIDKAQNCD